MMQKIKRLIVTLMILIFSISLLPTNNFVKASDDVNIISTTNLSVEVAKKWAKSKNATNTFINLADLYWKYSSSCGGVNPMIAYVQAALETGYGKFGGVIDESYHNPCGMKGTSGGSDTDANAHYRFNNWDEGVQAHMDHLALYAGANGYPKSNTYDPRHFSSIKGKAKTIKSLEGNWATAVGYGEKLFKLYNDVIAYSKTILVSRNNIDTKNNVEGNILEVTGWALNGEGISAINVYIDGVFKGTAQYGIARNDVYNVYPEYNNKNSGYRAVIDISNLGSGNKVLKVEQVAKDGINSSIQKTINISSVKARTNIDSPAVNSKVANHKQLTVRGWAINTKEISKINVYIDNILLGTTKVDILRADVKRAFPGYSRAEKSGYSVQVDISKISTGRKILKVEQVASDGSKSIVQRNINLTKINPITQIDTPTNIEGDTLIVKGWALNLKEISKINIYIDGILKGTATYGIKREDVYKVYPEYENRNSGYNGTINIANLSAGNKVLKIEQVAKDGSKSTVQKTIKISNIKARTNIDTPVANAKVENHSLLTVKGWAINTKEISKINIYLDNTLVGTTKTSMNRADVKRVYPNYSKAEASGFSVQVDISKISKGNKTLKVEQVANDGSKNIVQRKINVTKIEPKTCIDISNSIEGDTLTVKGWALNLSSISKINVYIDGKLKGTATYGIDRPDVYNAYPQYNNKKSGYTANIDISNLSAGNRVVKVEQVANDGSKSTVQKTINISSVKARTNIDSPVVNSNLENHSLLTVKGWAINTKDINKVNVYIDNTLIGTTKTGSSRPDVKRAYPNYSKAETSGYSVQLDISKISGGNKTLKVEQVASDGSKYVVNRAIKIISLDPIMCIDKPTVNQTFNINTTTLTVAGWALNYVGTKEVKVYIDNVYIKNAAIGQSRPDVGRVHPQYAESSKSGFSTTVDINKYSNGSHTIKVVAIGNDNTSVTINRTFVKGRGLKIVVDPGHNYGGDEGAVSKFNGTTYYERDINMKVSVYLKEYLEKEGYTVILTRQPSDRDKSDLNTSLANRVKIANSSKADLFISIHHNSFGKPDVSGTEVYYYNDKTSRVAKSKELATSTVNNIVSSTGFKNRGVKDSGFYVLKNTTMPAILVEGGFVSNEKEVLALSTDGTQKAIASSIVKSVMSTFK